MYIYVYETGSPQALLPRGTSVLRRSRAESERGAGTSTAGALLRVSQRLSLALLIRQFPLNEQL